MEGGKGKSTTDRLRPTPIHKFLDASRRYPVREVVDFYLRVIYTRAGEYREVSATVERVDC